MNDISKRRNKMSLPRWTWWVIGAVIVLILFVVLKVDIHLGTSGFSISQNLVH